MTERPTVVVSFRDVQADEEVRELAERRCRELAEEFPEVSRFEITFAADGIGLVAHARVTATGTETATHASATEPRPALDAALEKASRQLRRVHDKRIFVQRREAQRENPKRGR